MVTVERRTRRRLAAWMLILAIVLSSFVVRLVDIQVVRAAQLAQESEARRSIPITIHGARGDIVDANGVVLADSVFRYDITVSPRLVKDFTRRDGETDERVTRTVADSLAAIGGVVAADPMLMLAEIQAQLAENPQDDHAYLARNVTPEAFDAVRELGIPWVYWERIPSRTYPNGQIAGNLVGFLGTDGPQTGLELRVNDCLQATEGSATYERGADGVRLPGTTVVSQDAIDGGTLNLTIDADVQWFAQQAIAARATELGAEWATAVVVRVSNGHIVAAADWPTVDPNDVNGTAGENLGSRVFTWPYEPGSTIKSASFAALIDSGAATVTDQIFAPRRYPTIAGFQIGDAIDHGGLRYTTAGVFVNSSNTGTAVLSERLSLAQRHDYLTGFGFGTPTAVGFLGEEPGYVAPVAVIDGHTAVTQMFGQGMTATSAQVASMYQAIANGGVRLPLTLATGCTHSDGTVTHLPPTQGQQVVSASAARDVINSLENVASQGYLQTALTIPGYRLAAKTGTAEVEENGTYGSDRIITIAGLAPADNPQFVVVVTFGKPVTLRGSFAVAPTFRAIMTQVLTTFRVPPSTTPAPSIPLTW